VSHDDIYIPDSHFYDFATRQCQQKHYVFVLSINSSVRPDRYVIMIPREGLKQSQSNL